MQKKLLILFIFFTSFSLLSWSSTVTYYISAGQLVNMSWTCSGTGSTSYYFGTNWGYGAQGFSWTDNQISVGSTITAVTVDFYVGYESNSSGTYTTKFNGVATSSFSDVSTSCSQGTHVSMGVPTGSYVVGGTNSFLVYGTSIWGLYPYYSCSGYAMITVTFTGSVITPSPTISVTGTPLAGFGTSCINTYSSWPYPSYNVSGTGLTNNLVITPPAGYQISTDGFTWYTTPITITQSCGSASATVNVLFYPTSAGTFNSNITNASTGATTVNVAVTGTGINTPVTITASSSVAGAPSVFLSANLGGNITSLGCATTITERGVYWSTVNGFTPPGQGTKVPEPGSWGTGAFSELVSGLNPGTTYYYQAYATSSNGTVYSGQAIFKYITGSGGYQDVYTPTSISQFDVTGFCVNGSKVIMAGPAYSYTTTGGYSPNPFIITDTSGTFIKSMFVSDASQFGINRIAIFDADRVAYTGKSYIASSEAIVGMLNYTTSSSTNIYGYNRYLASPARNGQCRALDISKFSNNDLCFTGEAFETYNSWSGPSFFGSGSGCPSGYGYLAQWFGSTSYQRGDDVLLIRTGSDGDIASASGGDGFAKEYSLAYCGGGYTPAQPTAVNHSDGTFCWSGFPSDMVDSARDDVGLGLVEAGGNIFITGYTIDYASLIYEGNSFHDQEAFVIKTNSAGSVQWAKTFYISSTHNAKEEGDAIASVTSDGSNDVIITMRSVQTGNVEVARIANSNGAIVWAYSYNFGTSVRPWSIKETTNNTFIIGVMQYAGPIGSADVIILEITKDGTIVQSKGYGTSNADGSDSWDWIGPLVQQYPNGNYAISGTTNYSGGTTVGAYIVKANSSSNISGCLTNTFTTSPSVVDRNAGGSNQLISRTPIIYEMNEGINKASYAVTTTIISPDVTSSTICVLPVDLMKFEGGCENGTIKLNWTTASEQNNDYFTLERSADGTNFQAIAKVSGAGNSNTSRNYNYVDLQSESTSGTIYYRLSQTDFNGSTQTFSPISVSCSGNSDFTLLVNPNPVSNGTIFVAMNGIENKKTLVVLTDIYGREIYSKVIIEEVNSYLFSIDMENKLSPGIYFINATSNDKFISKKIIVVNK